MSVVVVGASLAGIRTAQALRSGGYDGRLALLAEDDQPSVVPARPQGLRGADPRE